MLVGFVLCAALRRLTGRTAVTLGYAMVLAALVGAVGLLVLRGPAGIAVAFGVIVVIGLAPGFFAVGGVRCALRRVNRAPAQRTREGALLVVKLSLHALPPVHLDVLALLLLGAAVALLANVAAVVLVGPALPVAGTVLLLLAPGLCEAAHEAGHLLVAWRSGWPVSAVWIGLGGAVQTDQAGRPTRSVHILLMGLAGATGGVVAGTVLGGIGLAIAGVPTALTALCFGAGIVGVGQLVASTDVVFVARGAAALLRGWRVVVIDEVGLQLRSWGADPTAATGDGGAASETSP